MNTMNFDTDPGLWEEKTGLHSANEGDCRAKSEICAPPSAILGLHFFVLKKMMISGFMIKLKV